jgi:hypothetical protein
LSCSSVPELAFADDRHRRKVGGDDEQEEREHTRHHEIAAGEFGIEPDADASIDSSNPSPAIRKQLGIEAADQAARVRQRNSR